MKTPQHFSPWMIYAWTNWIKREFVEKKYEYA